MSGKDTLMQSVLTCSILTIHAIFGIPLFLFGFLSLLQLYCAILAKVSVYLKLPSLVDVALWLYIWHKPLQIVYYLKA